MSNTLQLKRQSAGFTQAQIAKLAGITERGYRRYEASAKAKTKSSPDILTAIRIADVLGVQDLRELWRSDYPKSSAAHSNRKEQSDECN